MAEPLKNFFDERLIASIAADIGRVYPALDPQRFVADGMDGLEALALLARGEHLARVLQRHLPQDYERAVDVLLASLPAEPAPSDGMPAMAPFRYLPHVCFVARFGLEHFEASMRAQYELTQRFSAESSIRPFLMRHPEATYARLVLWASDPNVHVRRLVSEGTRPRLPWAPRLRDFQQDPTPVLALLERLKDDPERYVQRSVANNLNDIAKDHPDRVVEVCGRWRESASEARRWIVRHALRSLVKLAHPGALALVGAGRRPKVSVHRVQVAPARPRLGKPAAVSFELASTARVAQDLLVDYAVHFVKANGSRRPKVFKLRRLRLPASGRVELQARLSFVDLTTRKHYRGVHAIDLLVNGVRFALCEFEVA
ncbi:MAG TPA: DNA alkylation repair protein [Polyangiaceae bacterium]|nr:DNA alkylation repair protein [Polyangiaceae bacterium]